MGHQAPGFDDLEAADQTLVRHHRKVNPGAALDCTQQLLRCTMCIMT